MWPIHSIMNCYECGAAVSCSPQISDKDKDGQLSEDEFRSAVLKFPVMMECTGASREITDHLRSLRKQRRISEYKAQKEARPVVTSSTQQSLRRKSVDFLQRIARTTDAALGIDLTEPVNCSRQSESAFDDYPAAAAPATPRSCVSDREFHRTRSLSNISVGGVEDHCCTCEDAEADHQEDGPPLGTYTGIRTDVSLSPRSHNAESSLSSDSTEKNLKIENEPDRDGGGGFFFRRLSRRKSEPDVQQRVRSRSRSSKTPHRSQPPILATPIGNVAV